MYDYAVVFKRRYLLLAVLLLALAGCDQTALEPVVVEDETPMATAPAGVAKTGGVIPGQYIVVFHDAVTDASGLAHSLAEAEGGEVLFTYGTALKGFAGRLSERAAAALERNPNVAFVEPDGEVVALATQNNPPSWGLDRIDQRDLPLDDSYTYNFDGTGVTVYVLDTGIHTGHSNFGGRASVGFDAIGDGQNGQDCHGHGTHVAGTVGSTSYGVAKNAALVAVRVLDCGGSGSYSQVIAGIDWVTSNASLPAVANMSLGGGFSSAVNAAVENSVAAGVTYAVAAGNSNANACNYSPASAPSALTVGSTTITDARSSFSNFGTCVDLFAPGSSITSTWLNGGTNTISGTSMASPHVAGVAALYLDENPGASPSAVNAAIVGNASSGKVSNPGSGSPNLLLYSLFGSAPPPPPPPPPPPDDITLSTQGYKERGVAKVDLDWSGATSSNVDVYRNGEQVATTANDGAYTDTIGKGRTAKGTWTYQVCEAGSATACSNTSSVTF